MPSLLAQVRIPYHSTLPEDITVNTFSFLTSDVGDATLATIATRLLNFYNGVSGTQVTSIGNQLSYSVKPAESTLKIYNRSDPQPRAPIYSAPLAIVGAGSGSPLPEEVALCLSFRGPLQSGKVPARRRGRVYIGPLQIEDAAWDGTRRVRPQDQLMNSLVESGKRLMDATDAAVDWVVHSTVSVPGDRDTTVVHCWVDNAYDTQRRRGATPSARVTRTRSDQLP